MIDGSHIKIDKPSVGLELYVNQKGFHSIHVGIILQYSIFIFIPYFMSEN